MKYPTMVIAVALLMAAALRAQTELSVSAAASLKNAFTDIAAGFEQDNPGVRVLLNFAGSGQLQAQIEAGAPADVFAPASTKELDALTAKSLVLPGSVRQFAANALVLVKNNRNACEIKRIDDLKKPEVKKIAIGSAATVPAGKYATQALAHYRLSGDLQDKLVPCENVRQVLDYVERNEVDAGFVFSTDARIGKNVSVVSAIPARAHDRIIYPIGIVAASGLQDVAGRFIMYVSQRKDILKKYGFKV